LYAQFQKIITEDIPVTWIVELPQHTIYNKKVGNVPRTIWGAASPMDEVYLNK
jgi:peptide/nickel transport system substrate-binding protein